MAPALSGGELRGDRAQPAMRLDAYAAQRRYRRNHAVVAIKRRRFVGIASELGDDAERPRLHETSGSAS